jgi:hypothetical protein
MSSRARKKRSEMNGNSLGVVLSPGGLPGAERRFASWPSGEKLEYQKVFCTVEPDGHRGVRDRITTPISAVLANIEPHDFVWTWLGEVLVQKRVLEVFKKYGFSGYEAIPEKARYKSWATRPPAFWELAIRGSAGVASPESGIRILHKCPGCGLTDYSLATAPARVVDKSQWDGSDLFKVEPVSGWIFVTNRVVEALQANAFTGWYAKFPGDMQDSFDIVLGAQSRLGAQRSEMRARELNSDRE